MSSTHGVRAHRLGVEPEGMARHEPMERAMADGTCLAMVLPVVVAATA